MQSAPKIFLALDESGKLSLKDSSTHFIVGGYIYWDKEVIKTAIRKVEAEIKQKFNIPRDREFKGSKIEEMAIAEFLNGVFDEIGADFIPVASVVDKSKLGEHFTMSEALAYNFFVLNLIKFYAKLYGMTNSSKDINILMDERNLKKTEVNDLENILKTSFIEKPIKIFTYYLSSKTADIIRFADLIDHVIFHYYNNPEGYKNIFYQQNLKPEYWQRIKDGLIFYPFDKSFFKQNHNFSHNESKIENKENKINIEKNEE